MFLLYTNYMLESIFTQISNSYDQLISTLKDWAIEHGPNILLIILIAWIVYKISSKFVAGLLNHTVRPDLFPSRVDRERRLKTIEGLVSTIIKIFVCIIAFVLIIGEFGINTGPLLASAGVLGVALGFGAQSLIKDFTSGIFIIIDNQYRVGDYVDIEGIEGTVEAITIRTTILRDLSGNQHHITNGSITRTTNQTVDFGGIKEDILIGKDSDIEKVKLIINRIGEELVKDKEFADKIKEAPYFDRILRFEKDGILIRILGSTTAYDQLEVNGELYSRILRAFRKNNITIPSTQLHLETHNKLSKSVSSKKK